jgi:hypothetical protein
LPVKTFFSRQGPESADAPADKYST